VPENPAVPEHQVLPGMRPNLDPSIHAMRFHLSSGPIAAINDVAAKNFS
jgi:hypothetical protein